VSLSAKLRASSPPGVQRDQKEWTKGFAPRLLPTKPHPAIVPGSNVSDLPTPALLVDLDTMEQNLARMAAFFRDKPAKLRPHFKAHQSVALARKQIQGGAIGLTCARLEQAEMLLDEGFENILVANEIAGKAMLQRFVELSHRAPVIVAVDNASIVAQLAAIANDRVDELNVVVDLNVRLGRCGVQPGSEAVSLTKTVVSSGLRFRGLMGYEGHIHLSDGPEKHRIASAALQLLIDTKRLLEEEGIPVEIVTCGGTSDFSEAGTFPGVTEVQAGSYLLMDTWYEPCASDFKAALTVVATVISKRAGKTVVADAGIKAISTGNGLPQLKEMPGLSVNTLHIEHILMDIQDPSVPIDVGDRIEICVQALDSTLSLHDCLYGVRKGRVEEVFEITR
jgi:D-serine deaminase-like pyridoxal phosphate-dependent protein